MSPRILRMRVTPASPVALLAGDLPAAFRVCGHLGLQFLGLVRVPGDKEQLADQAPERAGVQLLELPGHEPLPRVPLDIYTRVTRLGPMRGTKIAPQLRLGVLSASKTAQNGGSEQHPIPWTM